MALWSLWLVAGMTVAQPAGKDSMLVYIGTYSQRGSEGVYVYRFDAGNGTLTDTGYRGKVASPSFVATNADGTRLYAANEDWSKPQGSVSAFAVDPATGALTLLSQASAKGSGPCHVAVAPSGRLVVAANYGSGSVVSLPLGSNGEVLEAADLVQHEGKGPNPKRQEKVHAHSATFDPTGGRVYVCDLGIDKIMIYRPDEQGKLVPNAPAFAAVHPGAGPRHMAFAPNGRFAYVINELDSTITCFAYDAVTGALTEVEHVPTLPADWQGSSTCADIHLDPSGKFLYGSNRGHDSIAVYAVAQDTGRLTLVQHQSTGGRTPRNFALDPSARWLIAANQDTDDLVVFSVDAATGKLTQQGQPVKVPAPVCVRFAPVKP
ncbi:MAG: lactonase family protein [Armatimonadetes bacterium]|nr:lactonase family protein [Armatimonadota bacterium]